MGLPLPPAKAGANVLVWGGSTSVGQYAIQLAKAAGCFVVTTASTARHDYLKQLGADACVDYKDSDVVAKIKQAVNGDLPYAIDCISEKGSTGLASDALSGAHPQITTILPVAPNEIPSNVQQRAVLMYTIFGREMDFLGTHIPAKANDKAFAAKYYQLLTDVLLPQGLLKPNKATKIAGGLNGVEEGFQRMMDNKIAAEKLVYTLAETH